MPMSENNAVAPFTASPFFLRTLSRPSPLSVCLSLPVHGLTAKWVDDAAAS